MPIQQWSDKIWVVTPTGGPSFLEEIDGARRSVEHHQPTPSVVVDLSGVEHLNSSDLSGLLRLRKSCTDRDVQIRVAAPNDSCWGVFITTGLDKVFQFSENAAFALASLQMEAGDEEGPEE